MELISRIPGFQPRNDERLLQKAEALIPALRYQEVCFQNARINGKEISPELLGDHPLQAGDEVLLDFGRHWVGRISLELEGEGSHPDAPVYFQIDLAEMPTELSEDPEVYHGWLSRSWIQQERLHVDTLPARVELPRRYAFRYVRLRVLGTSPKYQLVARNIRCRAESSAELENCPARRFQDAQLQSIYDASLRTLAECTQLVMEDGPKRDRRLWLGDLRLQALTSYATFRSLDTIKRCLYLFAGTRFPDGRISANVFTEPEPAADDTYLADYALLFPQALEEYLEETEDGEALGDLLEPGLEQVDYTLRHLLTAEGLVSSEAGERSFIDWSDGLNRRGALQGVLILALEAASRLCARAEMSERGNAYLGEAERLRQSARTHFWDAAEGCFRVDGQISLHTQSWLILAGVVSETEAQGALIRAVQETDAPRMVTPYMHHYYVTALLKAGMREQAENHLRAYWGGMLEAGADTFWEAWDPEHPTASPYGGRIVDSFCHAWSCTPAYLMTRKMFQKDIPQP